MQSPRQVIIKELDKDEKTGRPKYCGVVYGKTAKLYDQFELEYMTSYDTCVSKKAKESMKSDCMSYVFANSNHSKFIVMTKNKKVTNSLISAIKLEKIRPRDKILVKAIIECVSWSEQVYKMTRLIKFDLLTSDGNFHN